MDTVFVHCLFFPQCLVDGNVGELMNFKTPGMDTVEYIILMLNVKLDNPAYSLHHCQRCGDRTKIEERSQYLHHYIQAAETVQELEEMLLRHQEDKDEAKYT